MSIPHAIPSHLFFCTVDRLDGFGEILHEDFKRILLWFLAGTNYFEEIQ